MSVETASSKKNKGRGRSGSARNKNEVKDAPVAAQAQENPEPAQDAPVAAQETTKTRKKSDPLQYHLCEVLTEASDENIEKLRATLESGGAVLMTVPLEDKSKNPSRTSMRNAVNKSIKAHSEANPSPYVDRSLTIASFPEAKRAVKVEKTVTATEVAWA